MIMTPSKSIMSMKKGKAHQHGAWQPYEFPGLDLAVEWESENNNDYCQFRKWLISKESEFVQRKTYKKAIADMDKKFQQVKEKYDEKKEEPVEEQAQ